LPANVAKGATFETARGAGQLAFEAGQRETADVLREVRASVGADIRAALGGKLPKGGTNQALDGLADKISLERLGLPSIDATDKSLTILRRQSTTGDVVGAADELISRIASLSPDLERDIFKSKGLRINVGVPFTSAQAEIPLITGD